MDDKKKKKMFLLLVVIASIILMFVGVTFAYFSTTAMSPENVVNMTSIKLEMEFDDDTSLLKNNLIPSEERFIDIASKRVDSNGNFLKPYIDTNTNETIKANTACIDDNLNEICSMYTFTIYNPSLTTDLPLYIYLKPSVNEFKNLYFKIIDKNLNEVMSKTHLELGNTNDVILSDINNVLSKSIDNGHISSVTYTIVFWILETGSDQTDDDSGRIFASTLYVDSAFNGNAGITGLVSLSGTE